MTGALEGTSEPPSGSSVTSTASTPSSEPGTATLRPRPNSPHCRLRIEASLSVSPLVVQGRRGFVCALADMTERLRHHSEAAVKVINESSEASRLTIEQASAAGRSLEAVVHALRTLNQLNASIASATLQQSHVVEDINQNVAQAAGLSQGTAVAAEQSSRTSVEMKTLSEQLNGALRQFRI